MNKRQAQRRIKNEDLEAGLSFEAQSSYVFEALFLYSSVIIFFVRCTHCDKRLEFYELFDTKLSRDGLLPMAIHNVSNALNEHYVHKGHNENRS